MLQSPFNSKGKHIVGLLCKEPCEFWNHSIQAKLSHLSWAADQTLLTLFSFVDVHKISSLLTKCLHFFFQGWYTGFQICNITPWWRPITQPLHLTVKQDRYTSTCSCLHSLITILDSWLCLTVGVKHIMDNALFGTSFCLFNVFITTCRFFAQSYGKMYRKKGMWFMLWYCSGMQTKQAQKCKIYERESYNWLRKNNSQNQYP